jgi:hypothetical protein
MQTPPRETDRWTFHMQRGDFAAAWKICDEVLRARAGMSCAHLPRHLQWLWDGTPLDGKRVLIHCYHGLGDTVQFLRFAPLVKAVAREVSVWAQPALIPLLRSARGIDHVHPLHDGAPEISREVDVESMELGHVFRITTETIPASSYLHATPAMLPASSRALRVGIVWSVSDWNHAARSIPAHDLEEFLRVPDIEWHVLQRGRALAQWPGRRADLSGSDDVEVLAAIMRALDLVISVDSFPAHLAGSLGVPVWTLLPQSCDWRWMTQREDSPWYPTMRLFRQPRPEAWAPLIERVADELRSAVAAKRIRCWSPSQISDGRAEPFPFSETVR